MYIIITLNPRLSAADGWAGRLLILSNLNNLQNVSHIIFHRIEAKSADLKGCVLIQEGRLLKSRACKMAVTWTYSSSGT